MRRAYVYKPANITAPLFAFQDRPASAVLGWTDAEGASFALAVARNDLKAATAAYAAACAALGAANRAAPRMRRFWQAKAFRSINGRRAQLRQAVAALAAAMADPALASDQVPA